jgi:hypothetical protein
MKAKSIKGKSPEEIKNELAKSIADGFTPTLAIIFLSVNLNRDSIYEIFDEKGITIFGSTAAGEFINGELEKESAAILLLDMDKNNFFVHIEERSGKVN